MRNFLCKKCGRTVYLHHIHGMTNTEAMSGRALDQKCDVGFTENEHFGEYAVQDYYEDTVI